MSLTHPTNPTSELFQRLLKYIDDAKKIYVPPLVTDELCIDLMRKFAEIRQNLDTYWEAIDFGKEKHRLGLLRVVSVNEGHFQLRDNKKAVFRKRWDSPQDGHATFLMDFKQHDTIPIAPEEDGDYWYAAGRYGITILTIIAWTAAAGKVYHTFCSHVCEQSSAFTIACMEKVLAAGEFAGQTLEMWSDVGNHFRSKRFFGYWLYDLKDRFPTTKLELLPPGHGKGPCDGHFGVMMRWREEGARLHVIKTLAQYVKVMNNAAKAARRMNPRQPKRIFYAFTPPDKKDLPQSEISTKVLKECELPMKETFSWMSVREGVHTRLSGGVLADVPHTQHTYLAPADVSVDVAKKPDWKSYYQQKDPTARKINLKPLVKAEAKMTSDNVAVPTARKTSLAERRAGHARVSKNRAEREAGLKDPPLDASSGSSGSASSSGSSGSASSSGSSSRSTTS